ncbi:MAG: PAS domain S-box protein [Myxococcales bacterium]|nr:PAS domain S-box protein [Myxococcales bacterium]
MPDGEEQQGHNHDHNHGSPTALAPPILTPQFAALVRTMFTGVVVTRRDGVIVEANETFARSLGLTRDELIGRSTAELAIYEDPAMRARIYQELAGGGEVKRLAVHLRHRDGSTRVFLLSVKPLEIGGAPAKARRSCCRRGSPISPIPEDPRGRRRDVRAAGRWGGLERPPTQRGTFAGTAWWFVHRRLPKLMHPSQQGGWRRWPSSSTRRSASAADAATHPLTRAHSRPRTTAW